VIDFKLPYASSDLIHDRASIVDLNFVTRDKSYILSRIQYWKNYLRQKNLKHILVCSNTTLDTVCLFFASAEVGTLISTSNLSDGPKAFIRRANGVQLSFINPYFTSNWFDQNNISAGPLSGLPIMILDENAINHNFDIYPPPYVPEHINPNNKLIMGEAFVDGKWNNIVHNAGPFLYGGTLSAPLFNEKDKFGSTNGVTHVGLLVTVILAPLYSGATLYTINSFYDLLFMACRGLFTKVFFYEVSIKLTEWHPNFRFPIDSLRNTTVFTAGSVPSVHYMDTVFGAGAKKIVSLIGNNVTVSPLFKLEIPNKQFDLYNAGLGQPTEGAEVKVVDGILWAKTPSQSSYTETDADGFYCTMDYVDHKDNKWFYLGREYVETPSGNKVFVIQLQNAIQSCCDQDLLYTEFMVELPQSTDAIVNIYPLSLRAKRILDSAIIVPALQECLENKNITGVVIHKVVNDELLFNLRPNIHEIKQLIAEGKTL